MPFKEYVIGGIGGFIFGILIAFPKAEIPHNKIKKTVLEEKAEKVDFESKNKTSIIFQRLTMTGEHEYTGIVNGKSYVYEFKPEENKIELYLKIRKK